MLVGTLGISCQRIYLIERVVEEYLASVEAGHPIAPPKIMIELYFKSGTLPEYEGNGNSKKSDGTEGIRFSISFSDKFNAEYESLIKTQKLISLPIEFYEAKWFSFSRDERNAEIYTHKICND